MAKPQRKCIFCQGGNLSREHIWPQWASEHLPNFPQESHEEKVYSFTQKTKLTGKPKHRKTNGRIWTKKIKVVCKTCNETWMSQIEEKAKAIILPIMTGQDHQITQDGCLIISQWMTLKVMIAEHNNLNDPTVIVTTQEMRRQFREKLEIPENFWIWICKCGAPGWEATYIRSTATISLEPTLSHRNRNIQCITLGIGDILIQALHTSVKDLKLHFKKPPLITQIHPTSDNIRWPFARALTRDEAFEFSMSLDNMINSPNILWKP